MKTLLDEEQLRHGVRELADQITARYGQSPLTIIAVMTGSLVLLADLIRLLEMPLRVGLIQASSYRGGTEPSNLVIGDSLSLDIHGRDVLLIDDIFDTGQTLEAVVARMKSMGPKSLASGVLLFKEGRQRVSYRPDYIAFSIPDEFVVGYGLDYQDLYRNLPFLAVLEEADLEHVRALNLANHSVE